ALHLPAISPLSLHDALPICFSFAALSVFRLRRAEAASAVWIPHWHSEPFESQGARAAKRYVNGNLVEREKHHLNLHLNLGVGCAPSCWPIFVPKPPGCSQGAQRAVFCAV